MRDLPTSADDAGHNEPADQFQGIDDAADAFTTGAATDVETSVGEEPGGAEPAPPDPAACYQHLAQIWPSGVPTGAWITTWSKAHGTRQFVDLQEAAAFLCEHSGQLLSTMAMEGVTGHARGGAKNVRAVPGFAIDIDHLGGEHSETRLPTQAEALDLIRNAGVPVSFVLDSGGGYYAWVLLDEPLIIESRSDLNRAQALSLAWHARFREAAARHGWVFEHTHDLARCLRAAGTLNTKYTPHRLVRLEAATGQEPARFSLEALEELLPTERPKSRRQPARESAAASAHDFVELPHWLALAARSLGGMHRQFMHDGELAGIVLDVCPACQGREKAGTVARGTAHINRRSGRLRCKRGTCEASGVGTELQVWIERFVPPESAADLLAERAQDAYVRTASPEQEHTDAAESDEPQPDEAAPHARRPRFLIKVAGGHLPRMVDQAEIALLDSGAADLYQRAGQIVRLARLPQPPRRRRKASTNDVQRPPGVLRALPVDAAHIRERFTKAAKWTKFDARLQEWKSVDCPKDVAETYLARAGQWNLPSLSGFVFAPTVRHDMTLLSAEGYDVVTGLFADFGGVKFPPLDAQLTRESARSAVRQLEGVVQQFPFVAACDRAAFLAFCCTAVARPAFSSAPLFAVRATRRGTGKSLLVDIVSLIATGETVAVLPPVKDDEELRKRMLSVLLECDPISSLDNCDSDLRSGTLCLSLTQDFFKDRVLGKNTTARVSTLSTVWAATGNNLMVRGDMLRRVVPIDLDSASETPEERTFDIPDIKQYVLDNRVALVNAALTIVMAYVEAGRPDVAVEPLGSFEGWSEVVRCALIWAGCADPCEGRKRLEAVDPDEVQLGELLDAWQREFGDRHVGARDVVKLASEGKAPELIGLVAEIAGDGKGGVSAKRLGRWLLTHAGQVRAGLRIVRARGTKLGVQWRVESVGGLTGLEGSFDPLHAECQQDSEENGETHEENDNDIPIAPGETDSPDPSNPPDCGESSPRKARRPKPIIMEASKADLEDEYGPAEAVYRPGVHYWAEAEARANSALWLGAETQGFVDDPDAISDPEGE